MSRLRQVTSFGGQGAGVWMLQGLKPIGELSGTFSLDLEKLDRPLYTRLCRAVGDGVRTTRNDAVTDILYVLRNLGHPVPTFAPVGYMGKKQLEVLVPSAKYSQYATDLTAAGLMMDVDLTGAIHSSTPSDAQWSDLTWLRVSSYHVKTKGRGAYKHLQPATSKMGHLIRDWGKELLPLRRELLNWLGNKPTITFDLATGDHYVR